MKNTNERPGRVIFIIVNWNRQDLLLRCLNSLQDKLAVDYAVIVVDNASGDGSVEMIRTEFPEVILLENRENIGFARAVNKGLDYIRENSLERDYVVFLNNDVVLLDGSLKDVFNYMIRLPEVVAAVPAVALEDGRDQTGIGGYELTLASAFNYFFFLSILFPRICKGFYLHQPYFRKKARIVTLDWASGVCLVVRAKVFARINGFPEDFFMYAEDVALGRDLRAEGKIIFFPEARVVHLQQLESEGSAAPGVWLDSLFDYYRLQNGGKKRCRLVVLKMIFLAGFGLRWVYFYLLRSTKFSNHKKMLQIYCRHIIKSIFAGKAN